MLNSLKAFFQDRVSDERAREGVSTVSATDLASAAILIEVMDSDQTLDERETEAFLGLLQSSFGIAREDLQEMARLARTRAQQATSLYEFTRLINDEYDYRQKLQLITNMWRIAFSDQQLDKYEEHLIRKVADLIHVSHSDFIKTKLQARDGQ